MSERRDQGVLATTREAVRGRRRAAPARSETSDVTRVRGLALATAAGSVVLAAGVLLAEDPGALACSGRCRCRTARPA
ncbi:MAG: hypothetical protein H6713_11690 [Myxococcales bacterium]|nr:hypothetical protein [Myxococcales bacterium]